MKLSVSLPEEDVEFLDAYASARGHSSRSAAVRQAVRLLRAADLANAYEDAWQEWSDTEGSKLWEATSADGLDASG